MDNGLPVVSIIIPAYNAARFLEQAIDSVQAQTYREYEIILVDDGSTDDTLQKFEKSAGSRTILSMPHRGPSAARNAGIRQARGEYLAFLDADDRFLPTKLEEQVAYLDSHPDVDVVYSDGFCFWVTEDCAEVRSTFSSQGLLYPLLGEPEKSLPVLAIQNAFPIHAALVRRRAVLAVEGFDESLFGREDWDLWLRVAEKHTFSFLNAHLALYRMGTGGVSDQFDDQAHAIRRIGRKVEATEWFKKSPNMMRSDFYFCWGVQELEYRQTEAALQLFRGALSCNPRNYLARGAVLAVRAFGERAISLYHLKRRYLGDRSISGPAL